ncbi:MAG: GNAT family N-acetyltransferase [Paracoccaceae bacterium]
MTVLIEPGVAADAVAIAGILTGWIDETDWMPRVHSPSSYLGFGQMLLATCDVTVARDGAVVGFLARQGADIQAFYLAPGARGQGLGTSLLDHVKAQVDMLDLWTFQANAGALLFYARHRFVEDQRTDGAENDEKLPDVHMNWRAENG